MFLNSSDTRASSQGGQVGQRLRGCSHAGKGSRYPGKGEGGRKEGFPPGRAQRNEDGDQRECSHRRHCQ